MGGGLETWSARQMRREITLTVERFKREHPGVLEARTAAREQARREHRTEEREEVKA